MGASFSFAVSSKLGGNREMRTDLRRAKAAAACASWTGFGVWGLELRIYHVVIILII